MGDVATGWYRRDILSSAQERSMPQVKIGPNFFAKVPNDYEDWHWAWVREIMQNSIDAPGSDLIDAEFSFDGMNTIVTVSNNGRPMTEDILVNKLLALGESGKDFSEENVGGFGKAKELLYFTHVEWSVKSGKWLASGSGGEYEINPGEYFHGTRSIVVMKGNQVDELKRNFEKFAFWAQWSGTLYVNGELQETSHRKGSPRRDLGFAKVYSNRTTKYKMCVRIGGIPMFIQSTAFDKTVIVELKGKSNEVLTANRDGMVRPFRSELAAFVTELAVDKRSALKDRRNGPRYKQYRGTKLCHQRALNVVSVVHDEPVSAPEGTAAIRPVLVGPDQNPVDIDEGEADGVDVIGGDEPQDPVYHVDRIDQQSVRAAAFAAAGLPEPRRHVATLGHNFVLKNETDLKIPAYFDPGSGEFSSYSLKLTRFWGRIMLELHRLFDVEDEFSIGFIFDETSEAEHEKGDYGRVYYLNPCEIVEQQSSYSKSFRKRFLLTDRDRLIMIGLHELVHGLGMSWHDESYANKLTDMAWKVMKNRKRFNWCFK
jgi:hypothetical protein